MTETGSPQTRMTPEEGWAAFAFIEASGLTPAASEVARTIAAVHGNDFDIRTVRRLLRLAQELFAKEARGESSDLPLDARRGLADTIKSGATEPWVRERIWWFLKWRADQRRETEQRRTRLERVLGQIWVPEYWDIPPFMLRGDPGAHGRDMRGRMLRWTQKDRRSSRSAVLEFCWLGAADHSWLRDDVISSLPKPDRHHLLESYDLLQKDAATYLEKASRYRSEEEIGGAAINAGHVREALRGERSKPEKDKYMEKNRKLALYLADEPARLQDQVAAFVDSLRLALELGAPWKRTMGTDPLAGRNHS